MREIDPLWQRGNMNSFLAVHPRGLCNENNSTIFGRINMEKQFPSHLLAQ